MLIYDASGNDLLPLDLWLQAESEQLREEVTRMSPDEIAEFFCPLAKRFCHKTFNSETNTA